MDLNMYASLEILKRKEKSVITRLSVTAAVQARRTDKERGTHKTNSLVRPLRLPDVQIYTRWHKTALREHEGESKVVKRVTLQGPEARRNILQAFHQDRAALKALAKPLLPREHTQAIVEEPSSGT